MKNTFFQRKQKTPKLTVEITIFVIVGEMPCHIYSTLLFSMPFIPFKEGRAIKGLAVSFQEIAMLVCDTAAIFLGNNNISLDREMSWHMKGIILKPAPL